LIDFFFENGGSEVIGEKPPKSKNKPEVVTRCAFYAGHSILTRYRRNIHYMHNFEVLINLKQHLSTVATAASIHGKSSGVLLLLLLLLLLLQRGSTYFEAVPVVHVVFTPWWQLQRPLSLWQPRLSSLSSCSPA